MPLQATSGAASYDAFGGGVAAVPNYIEDVFSTWLYTGNGSTQTITNGIDLAGKGGLVWIKQRTVVNNHFLAHAPTVRLRSDTTNANVTTTDGVTSFNANGFSIGANGNLNGASDGSIVSWTFREQPKFFDVVTFTGDGTTNKVIPHNLGSVPGFIVVKRTDSTGDWQCWHTTFTPKQTIFLNQTTAMQTYPSATDITVTSTSFTIGTNQIFGNGNGWQYVGYLFAHNAGGFGLTGTDNVISCGSYTGTGSTPLEVNLGFEAQWVLIKRADGAVAWYMGDVMRGLANTSSGANTLQPNTSNAEQNTDFVYPTATGFAVNSTFSGFNASGGTYIYIAIRRGPMRTPTSGTSVFNSIARAGTSAVASVTGVGFTPDTVLIKNRGGNTDSVDWSYNFFDRLRNPGFRLSTAFTNAEDTSVSFITSLDMNGMTLPGVGYTATNGSYNYINHFFRRAPGFFDEVCYTGNQPLDSTTAQVINHNLGVPPELIIFKARSAGATNWIVTYNMNASTFNRATLNLTNAGATSPSYSAYRTFLASQPTATQLSLGSSANTVNTVNYNGYTYVAYLFASCPGVSKVGSYTGNGSSQTINCGFTGGARFVLIKRTDSTGDWYVWDTARGIVSGNDPHLSLNTTAAEVTSNDTIDTDSTGFVVNQVAATNVNVNSATYIYLAIA